MLNWAEPRIWYLVRAAALGVGFIASVSFMRDYNWAYNFHLNYFMGSLWQMGLSVSLFLFIACALAVVVSVIKTKSGRPFFFRKTDIAVLAVLAYGTVALCLHFTGNNYGLFAFYYPVRLLVLSFASYAAVMFFFTEVCIRIRDKQLYQTLYWLRFFKLYPVTKPVGLLMAVLLTANPLAFYAFFPLALTFRGYFNPPLLVIYMVFICTLTYFVAFVLNLSNDYEKANVNKLKAERFKSELIANVSHDIRTPLTSIINYVDLMKALPIENPDFAIYINILDRKSARLKVLINDLMEASKASTGNLPIRWQSVDLTEMAWQIAGEFDEIFSERDLTLVMRQLNGPAFIQADSRHLWRVLENLFSNASKYAMPGTRVFMEITEQDGHTNFCLINTSQKPIDIDGGVLAEQFIRGDRARQTEGSGLGLYIAKSLTELMGGRFDITVTGDLFSASVSLKVNAPTV
jgi:signal transduction histidine kinase